MPKFNVISEPWIDVVTKEGLVEVVGIRKLFENAHNYIDIVEESPLKEYGIFRLLTVFLMDMYEPVDVVDLKEILSGKQFNISIFDKYIQKCELEIFNCFDLFDKEHPFLQTKYNEGYDKIIKPINVIDCEIPSGNDKPLYYYGNPLEVKKSYADCLKSLCSIYPFSTAMAQGYPSCINSTPPYYFIIKGENLFETLIYNSITKSTMSLLSEYNNPKVVWRNKKEVVLKEQLETTSLLEGMTLLPRRVTLIPNEDNETVSNVYFSQGINFIGYSVWRDPHTAVKKGKDIFTSIKPSANKKVWQEIGVIFTKESNDKLAPITIQQMKDLNKDVDNINATVYGVITNQAVYLNTIREVVSIPFEILEDETKMECFSECIRWVEEVEKCLRSDIRKLNNDLYIRNIKNYVFSELAAKIINLDLISSDDVTNIYDFWKSVLLKEAMSSYVTEIEQVNMSAEVLKKYIKESSALKGRLRKLLEKKGVEDK